MLKKAPGNFLVEKLRVLLLLEAHVNALHKINFNGRLIPSFEDSSAMPQTKLGGRRSKAASHLAISKKLIEDI